MVPHPLYATTGLGRRRLGQLRPELGTAVCFSASAAPAAFSPKSATMEAQAQGEWSLADRPEGQLRGAQEGVFRYHLTSRTEWSGAIFARPQLCSYPRLRDNSCSPNSGFAVGLGTSEGTPNWRGSSAGNAPTECSTSFPQPVAPTLRPPEPRGCPKNLLCRVGNPCWFLFPRGSREEALSTLLALRVGSRPAAPKFWAEGGARGGGGAAETRVSRIREGLAARGSAFANQESFASTLISRRPTRVSLFPTVGDRPQPPQAVLCPPRPLGGCGTRDWEDELRLWCLYWERR